MEEVYSGNKDVSKKTKWTTVKLPVEIRDKIKRLAGRFGMSQWELVNWTLGFAESQLRKPKIKKDLPALDKISWYAAKLGMAVGAFRENPTEDNLGNAERVCIQIMERLGVDTSSLIKVLHDYWEKRDKRESRGLKMEISMELKFVIMEMMYKHLIEDNDNGKKK